ncbi:heme d1 biosynthesis radical SAM protein NirJ [Rhodoblastus sp.]|uniref:heme d1 biosynthesis radical SAM protein NirJ n=1 Tax=Rhodoblastus sp. TaxID=1962975 RepID=UPI0035B0BD76
MFRLTEMLRELRDPSPVGPRRDPPGPVVIWNLIRRCNLKCKHCYSISADVDFPGELSTDEVFAVMDELKRFRVPALILSGGEPLLRPDIFDVSRRAKAMRFYTALSSNGALIDETAADQIAEIGYDYVGVSLDGIGATHDRFRGQTGSFDAALAGVRACVARGIKVGLRFTMTLDNFRELPRVIALAETEGVKKFYLSHLVYAGRGNKNRGDDANWTVTRETMDFLIDTAWQALERGDDLDFVTGNNDADAVWLYFWTLGRFPDRAAHLRGKLAQWGGNSSGVNVANIDNLGNVHPDTMWWSYSLGNVRERAFSQIWTDVSDPIMAGLKQRPRKISGRCGSCAFFDICGGNTRVRALQLSGDAFAEDPACYLTDQEIGAPAADRLTLRPFRGTRHEAPRL